MWALRNRTGYAAERNWTRDRDGVHWWVVAVRATFKVGAGGRLALADEQPPPVLAPVYFGEPGASSLRYDSDLLSVKPGTDVVVHAHAHAPGGRAAVTVPVALRIGALEKRLVVHGDRVYYRGTSGLTTTAPRPFTERPIRYEMAFGGRDLGDPDPSKHRIDDRNPLGLGFAVTVATLINQPAHTVEYPDGDPAQRGPAGFGPVDAAWMPRRELAGTYDHRWSQNKKPLLPDDYDARFAMGAPADQQPPQPLIGGERVVLTNLTREGSLAFELPRVALGFSSRFGRRREEHGPRLATVLIEPEERRLSLVWQSALRVSAEQADYLDETEIVERRERGVSAGGGDALDIVAIGARTPVGISAEESAASVRAGISRAREFPFVDAHGEPVVLATDGALDAQLEGRERVWALLESALDQVMRKVGGLVREAGAGQVQAHAQVRQVHLLLALPEARPGFSEGDAAWIVEAAGRRVRASRGGAGADVAIAGRGHAGAIRAVESVMREARGRDDVLWLVAGADSYVHTETFLWLESQRRFAQAGVRSGFVPGEGAGCIALATPRARARLRARLLAAVGGAATTEEKQVRGSEAGSSGAGLAQAVRGAMAGVALPAQAADAIYIDINGERYRSEEWGFVALKAPEAFKSLQYRAPSDCWGDVGAAFGALGAILAVQSYARGYARGPRSLVLAGSDGGLRGAMLLLDPRTL